MEKLLLWIFQVDYYMAGKPNQSCHKFVEYVLKG